MTSGGNENSSKGRARSRTYSTGASKGASTFAEAPDGRPHPMHTTSNAARKNTPRMLLFAKSINTIHTICSSHVSNMRNTRGRLEYSNLPLAVVLTEVTRVITSSYAGQLWIRPPFTTCVIPHNFARISGVFPRTVSCMFATNTFCCPQIWINLWFNRLEVDKIKFRDIPLLKLISYWPE
jgi:hypothetical protein